MRSAFISYHVVVGWLDMAHAVEVGLPSLGHKLHLAAAAVEVRPTTMGELGTVHARPVVEEAFRGAGVYCEKGTNDVF